MQLWFNSWQPNLINCIPTLLEMVCMKRKELFQHSTHQWLDGDRGCLRHADCGLGFSNMVIHRWVRELLEFSWLMALRSTLTK